MTSTARAVLVPLVLASGLVPSAALADDADAAPAVPASTAAPPPKTLSYGVGLRVGGGYTSTTDATVKSSVGIESLDVRPYISGQVHPLLKFEGNLDLNNGDQSRIHVLDAVAKFEPDDLFNVWFGRFLPPSDRANLSGPYYQNAWNFPAGVNGYPSIYAGRDDGGAVWGQLEKGKFKYQAGVFTLGTNTPTSQALYAGRLVLNLLDPEPGYYNSSTYYGTKDVLAAIPAHRRRRPGPGPRRRPQLHHRRAQHARRLGRAEQQPSHRAEHHFLPAGHPNPGMKRPSSPGPTKVSELSDPATNSSLHLRRQRHRAYPAGMAKRATEPRTDLRRLTTLQEISQVLSSAAE